MTATLHCSRFAVQFGRPLKFDADADSWAQTLEFLKATLK